MHDYYLDIIVLGDTKGILYPWFTLFQAINSLYRTLQRYFRGKLLLCVAVSNFASNVTTPNGSERTGVRVAASSRTTLIKPI
jgi:hypothetical protein